MNQNINQELKRVFELSEFDLDYSGLESNFKDLSRLAAKVAGTDISMINLIDTYTQWTIANHGLEIEQMPREDSVCQFTIAVNEPLEIKDLKADNRFFDKPYVEGENGMKYYFGVQLKTTDGNNLGSLCVLDKEIQVIDSEKEELLKIIADEIVNRLVSIKRMEDLNQQLSQTNRKLKNLAHDIRGPLGGIISLTDMLGQQGDNNELTEVLEYVKMMHGAGVSLLDLATDIMELEEKEHSPKIVGNIYQLKDKLEKLYTPQAIQKQINLNVSINSINGNMQFPKKKLVQIIGNLISNAIKFTKENGEVSVTLAIETNHVNKLFLKAVVQDTGKGIDQLQIATIRKGIQYSTTGTTGELGFGLGLNLVNELTRSLNGELQIQSEVGKGSCFTVLIPID